VGVKTRLLPKFLREGSSPWLAVPVGLLFGFGFETSSQVATYAVAFGVNSGILGALFVGAMFCLGMLCTDTLDSVLVHRLVSDRSALQFSTMRVWIWSVTIVALVVAAYEFAQVLGWQAPFPDIYVSVAIVASLVFVFAYVFARTKNARAVPSAPPQVL
jgi:high-affinity nickel-transport protein